MIRYCQDAYFVSSISFLIPLFFPLR